jgi:hypothetical protein
MKWLKEQGCPWDFWTSFYAKFHGNSDNIRWLREQGCPLSEDYPLLIRSRLLVAGAYSS